MSIEFQKIAGAILFALILTVGVNLIGDIVIPTEPPADHAGRGEGDQPQAPAAPAAPEADASAPSAAAPADSTEQAPAEPQQPAAADTAPPAGGGGLGALIAQASAEQGQKAARKCTPCHSFDDGGANRVGPNLHGVVGADIASKEYRYSDALTGKDGEWSYQKLDEFLTNPAGWAPGTKMTFAGIKKAEERAAVIAYLRSISPEAPPP